MPPAPTSGPISYGPSFVPEDNPILAVDYTLLIPRQSANPARDRISCSPTERNDDSSAYRGLTESIVSELELIKDRIERVEQAFRPLNSVRSHQAHDRLRIARVDRLLE